VTITALAANRANLIPAGSVWKYLDNGSDQGTAWIATNFNDTLWASGRLNSAMATVMKLQRSATAQIRKTNTSRPIFGALL
jgi:hypothetical protein